MNLQEAKAIVGNQRRCDVKKMVAALSLHPWLNTPAEALRLEAGKLILRHK